MDRQVFDDSVDVLKALLWQYNDATNLQGLLESKQSWYNSEYEDFWNTWFDDVFNIDTCNDFGASVWAIILGISFTVQFPPQDSPSWGFDPYNLNFFSANFGAASQTSKTVNLTQKRLILKLRYFQLISRGTIPETNQFMDYLFRNEGTVFVQDLYDMTYAVYIFDFAPTSQTLFVLQQYDLLPRPAGVGVQLQIVTRSAFGFAPYNLNFYSANFGDITP